MFEGTVWRCNNTYCQYEEEDRGEADRGEAEFPELCPICNALIVDDECECSKQ
jgi:hypothetical protein